MRYSRAHPPIPSVHRRLAYTHIITNAMVLVVNFFNMVGSSRVDDFLAGNTWRNTS